MQKIELGKKYKDDIHGVEGVAVCHAKYFTGCDQIQLEYVDTDGDIRTVWFDITRLVGVEIPPEDVKPGGPQGHAPARHP